MLAQIGREGDRNRLGVERAGGVYVFPGLLALESPIGADLADPRCQQTFNSRSLAGNEFTGATLVHDDLLGRIDRAARPTPE
jgi:hypothetical protein